MVQVLIVLGLLDLFIAASMLIPLTLSVILDEPEWVAFLWATLITLAAGLALYLPFPKEGRDLNRRQAFAIVSFGWLSAGLFGALPFALSGLFSPIDALFETVSGFTTTGASVLTRINDLPKGILLWRSFIQWLGGMGIILLSIAVLPLLGVGGMQLYRAEVPGPFLDKLKPRMAETAKILWETYLLITGLQVALLLFGGMSVFDAFCHAFTTMATGGFSTKIESIGYYGSYHRIVIMVFMFLAGANFALHYRFMRGGYGDYWRDPEFRFYLWVLLLSTLTLWWVLVANEGGGWLQRLEDSAFQTVSIMTTTGYATVDFDKWPSFGRYLLLVLMFVGGCAGSTGGGIKCVRILLLCKYLQGELRKLIHPHAVVAVKLGPQNISPAAMNSILGMFVLYLGVFVLASIVMTLLGLDLETSISSVAATLGNIGPGLAQVGPVAHYGDVPVVGKIILIFCMLAGRLEIYTVFILLFPEFWRK